jgi:uncharacterized protein (TIGR01777 family)
MDVVVTGSSGLVGRALVPALSAAGHRPIRLVRREPAQGRDEIRWQPSEGRIDAASLEGAGAVVHLAGAGIGDKRWNDDYKRLLLSSRVEGTTLLATTLASLHRPPQCLLSGSAIGYYGDRGDEALTEDSEPGTGFLTEVCLAWEAAARPAAEAGIRTVALRTGIVLSARGGALAKMLPLFKLGLGGRIGSGRQYQSWIAIEDEVGAIVHLLTSSIAGPVNLTAPNPVTNSTFTRALGAVLGRPTLIPIPAFGPKLLLGSEMAQNLLLDGQRVLPEMLKADGYSFAHTEIESGLRAAVADR